MVKGLKQLGLSIFYLKIFLKFIKCISYFPYYEGDNIAHYFFFEDAGSSSGGLLQGLSDFLHGKVEQASHFHWSQTRPESRGNIDLNVSWCNEYQSHTVRKVFLMGDLLAIFLKMQSATHSYQQSKRVPVSPKLCQEIMLQACGKYQTRGTYEAWW